MTADSWLRATIAGLELFRGLPDEVLAAVTAQAKPATFRAGEALMRRGDPPESVHVLLRGRVRVELPHPAFGDAVLVTMLGPG